MEQEVLLDTDFVCDYEECYIEDDEETTPVTVNRAQVSFITKIYLFIHNYYLW